MDAAQARSLDSTDERRFLHRLGRKRRRVCFHQCESDHLGRNELESPRATERHREIYAPRGTAVQRQPHDPRPDQGRTKRVDDTIPPKEQRGFDARLGVPQVLPAAEVRRFNLITEER